MQTQPSEESAIARAHAKPWIYATKPTGWTVFFAHIPAVASVAFCLDQPEDDRHYSP